MNQYHRDLLLPDERPVEEGICSMGTYWAPFTELNLLEAEKPLGALVPSCFKSFRLKEWEAFQISDENYFICLAVSNFKLLGVAFIFIYDKLEERYYRYFQKTRANRVSVPTGLMESVCHYSSETLNIRIGNHLSDNLFTIHFSAEATEDQPACEGQISASHDNAPLVIVHPLGKNRPLYSHKALMKGYGTVTVGEKTSRFKKGATAVILDDHKGFYPYHTRYDWLTALKQEDGHLIGFNLTDNQVKDPERYNENCLWVDGRMCLLPPVKMIRSEGLKERWEISDTYDRVSLSFTPLCGEPMKKRFGMISTFYYGPIGRLKGYIIDDDGDKVSFDDWIGMGESRNDRM